MTWLQRQYPIRICWMLATVCAAAAPLQALDRSGGNERSSPADQNAESHGPETSSESLRFAGPPQQDQVRLDFRDRLEEQGIRGQLYLNNQSQAVVKRGLNTEGLRNSASLDAFLTVDLDTLGVLPDADVLLHLQSNWGDGINFRTGSTFQINDDADGDLGLHVAQLWFRKQFADRRISLTLGFLDFQTIADRNAFANSEDKQFMHQALDNNPLIPLGIGLGASLSFRPNRRYELIVGVSDAQSVLYKPGFSTAFHDENRWFVYLQQGINVQVPSASGPLEGNYRAGLLYDPRPRDVFSASDSRHRAPSRGHDYAFYISADQMLIRESPDDAQGLGVFGRFGYRTPETNRFARFYSAGVSYTGLFPGRDQDVLGFGFALSAVSNDYRRKIAPDADRETVYELFYAIQVNKWLVITPDVQYIDNPGAGGDLSHAITAGLRARISL